MNDAYRKKRIRLPETTYGVSVTVWLVTTGTEGRKPCFADDGLATKASDVLVSVCAHHGATLIAGCVMPDHAHAVVEITTGNLVAIVRSFKSLVVRQWWESGESGTLWQRSFHDRGLRTRADIESTVDYVLQNPVRAGLVDLAEDFPHLRGLMVGNG